MTIHSRLSNKVSSLRQWALAFSLVSVTIVSTQPAHADWQYTRWGMSQEEVIAASNGAVQRNIKSSDPDQIRNNQYDLKGIYRAGGKTFVSFFKFTDNKLSKVTLASLQTNDRCENIYRQLIINYGNPYRHTSQRSIIDSDPYENFYWNNRKGGNAISMYIPSGSRGCSLTYEPLPSGDGL